MPVLLVSIENEVVKQTVRRRSISPGKWLTLATLLCGMLGLRAHAQSDPVKLALPPAPGSRSVSESSPQLAAQRAVPDAPGQATTDKQTLGRIYGTVTDPHGNVVVGASVTLKAGSSNSQQTVLTDSSGSFTFPDLAAGTYRVTITAKSFADWTRSDIVLTGGQYYDVPEIVLKVAPANTNVEVVFTPYEEAEEQIKAQEQQRIIGVFPNFYASYVWHAVPMTSGQKFRLAVRTSIDPVTFGIAAATAGIEEGSKLFQWIWAGSRGVWQALWRSVCRRRDRHFYRERHSAVASASRPPLFLQGHGQRSVKSVVCNFDGGDLQRRQRALAAKLLQRGRQPDLGWYLKSVLSGEQPQWGRGDNR